MQYESNLIGFMLSEIFLGFGASGGGGFLFNGIPIFTFYMFFVFLQLQF
jgi:hypothetical protein